MREIRTSGLMSGEGKRSDANAVQTTAPYPPCFAMPRQELIALFMAAFPARFQFFGESPRLLVQPHPRNAQLVQPQRRLAPDNFGIIRERSAWLRSRPRMNGADSLGPQAARQTRSRQSEQPQHLPAQFQLPDTGLSSREEQLLCQTDIGLPVLGQRVKRKPLEQCLARHHPATEQIVPAMPSLPTSLRHRPPLELL